MSDSQKPPLFSSWTAWYILVLGVLVVQIVVYRVLTVAFS
jgi:hypothetical protein